MGSLPSPFWMALLQYAHPGILSSKGQDSKVQYSPASDLDNLYKLLLGFIPEFKDAAWSTPSSAHVKDIFAKATRIEPPREVAAPLIFTREALFEWFRQKLRWGGTDSREAVVREALPSMLPLSFPTLFCDHPVSE